MSLVGHRLENPPEFLGVSDGFAISIIHSSLFFSVSTDLLLLRGPSSPQQSLLSHFASSAVTPLCCVALAAAQQMEALVLCASHYVQQVSGPQPS